MSRPSGIGRVSTTILAAVTLAHCADSFAVAAPPRTPEDVVRDEAARTLAPTPPMGWNSWNNFGCHVSDALIREVADAIAQNGMKDAGYRYVNIDDCWEAPARIDGHLHADPLAFPHGMKPLAAYLHGKGLKLGIYSDHGTNTCEMRPGSHGYEQVDANDFAAWGVDYLKYDNCNEVRGASQSQDYRAMMNALLASGRPIVFSICAWKYQGWMPTTGNLWRTSADIRDNWAAILREIDANERYAALARPGRWNDPDALEVGNGGMSDDEYRAHFSMWAMMAAPLIAGNDVRTMSEATASILMNREVIAVDQDPLGMQGTKVADLGDGLEVYARGLAGQASRAVVLFNRSKRAATMTVTWAALGLDADLASVRDLWAHATMGEFRLRYAATVAPHGVVMLKIDPTPRPP